MLKSLRSWDELNHSDFYMPTHMEQNISSLNRKDILYLILITERLKLASILKNLVMKTVQGKGLKGKLRYFAVDIFLNQ